MKITIHTDGGARGNPGPAAIGVVIEIYQSDPLRQSVSEASQSTNPTNNKKILTISRKIGETTNNVAEYMAVQEALQFIKSQKSRPIGGSPKEATKIKGGGWEKIEIHFYLDSTLVVNQLNGLFKIKDSNLRQLAMNIRVLEGEVGGEVSYTAVPREQNTAADTLVNKALDSV